LRLKFSMVVYIQNVCLYTVYMYSISNTNQIFIRYSIFIISIQIFLCLLRILMKW